jgi:hypothetical protein
MGILITGDGVVYTDDGLVHTDTPENCVCCGGVPGPEGACLPCGDFTTYFGGCFSPTNTPLGPVVPGCDDAAHQFPATAWDKPSVSITISYKLERISAPAAVIQEFDGGGSMTVCRNAACSVFSASLLTQSGGDDWLIALLHNSGVSGSGCSQVPSNDQFNLEIDLSKQSGTGVGNYFSAHGATRDGSPCFDTGFLVPNAGVSEIVVNAMSSTGACSAKRLTWSGSATYTNLISGQTFTETMTVSLRIDNGFEECPSLFSAASEGSPASGSQSGCGGCKDDAEGGLAL